MPGDFVHEHGSRIWVVRGCLAENGLDLVAVGGEHSVEILSCDGADCDLIATFYVGISATAVAWSPRTSSPRSSTSFFLELVVACSDGSLRHLCKSQDVDQMITPLNREPVSRFNNGINDLTFCGDGHGNEGWRYIATAGDDGRLTFWDLRQASDEGEGRSQSRLDEELAPSPEPLTWSLELPNPLHTVLSHRDSAKEILVSDSKGSAFIIDWTTGEAGKATAPEQIVAEFIDPYALTASRAGTLITWGGSAAWRHDDLNTLGATWGDKWVLWDQMKGSKPVATGPGFSGGSARFRWCPTDSNLFALSPVLPAHRASLQIFSVQFLNSQPTQFNIDAAPHRITDFDWLGVSYKDSPLMAVAMENTLRIIVMKDVDEEEQ